MVRERRGAARSQSAHPAFPAALTPAGGKGTVPIPGAVSSGPGASTVGRGKQGQQWSQGTEGERQSPTEGKSWWWQKEDGFSSSSAEPPASGKISEVMAASGSKMGRICLSLGMRWIRERFLSECVLPLTSVLALVEEFLCSVLSSAMAFLTGSPFELFLG